MFILPNAIRALHAFKLYTVGALRRPLNCDLVAAFTPTPKKSHQKAIFLAHLKIIHYLCIVNLRRGMSVHHRWRVADILKRRLLALCSDYQKCRKFQYIQDLATIDVLRDINYPSCAYLVRLLRIYICAHAYLNYVAREYSFIFGVGFALSVLMYKAMRQPLIVELTKGKFHAFLLCLIGLENSPVSKNIYV